MGVVDLINSIWVPVAFFIMCLIYGIYMLITKDAKKIRKKDDIRDLKDPVKYATNAGYLFLFMALGCLIMIIILKAFGNDLVATIESLVWFVVFAIFWKINDNKYGAF